MGETRKLAAILVSDVVGYSRLAGADEDRILARLRALRSDLIDPTIAVHHGRIVKRTGDGAIVEFRSVVDAVNCAIEIQRAMVERNAGVAPDKRIEFRIGIHLGDVVEESDGDLMGDGVNIAARLEGIAKPGAICLSEDAYRQVKGRLDLAVTDLGPTQLKNIAEPMRVYSLRVGALARRRRPKAIKRRTGRWLRRSQSPRWHLVRPSGNSSQPLAAPAPLSIVVLPFANLSGDPARSISPTASRRTSRPICRASATASSSRATPPSPTRARTSTPKQIGKELGVRYVLEGSRAARRKPRARQRPTHRRGNRRASLGRAVRGRRSPICSSCRIRSSRGWPIALNYELVKAEAEKAPAPKAPTRSISTCAVGPWCNKSRSSPTRTNSNAARLCSNSALEIDPERTPMRLAGDAYDLFGWSTSHGWANPGPITRPKYLVRPTGPSRSPPIIMQAYLCEGVYLTNSRAREEARRSATPDSPSIRITPPLVQIAKRRRSLLSAVPKQAKSDVQQAMRLSPRDPTNRLVAWMHSG